MRVRTLFIAATATALLGIASTASASGTYGPKIFSLTDKSFTATDSNGTFSAQVSYTVTGTSEDPMGVSFNISPYLQGISTGTKTCIAYQSLNGVHQSNTFGKSGMGPNYIWHFTVPRNPIGANGVISGSCTFPVEVSGNPGKAVVKFEFDYVVGDGGGDVVRQSATTESIYNANLSFAK